MEPEPQAYIVVPLLQGWVNHFNSLSNFLAEAGWDVFLQAPRADKDATEGPETEGEISRLVGKLHKQVHLHFLPYSWKGGQVSVVGGIRSILYAGSLAI